MGLSGSGGARIFGARDMDHFGAPALPLFAFNPIGSKDRRSRHLKVLKPSYGVRESAKIDPSGVSGDALGGSDFDAFRGPRNATDDI